MMERLTLDTKKLIANLLVDTAIKRILDEKKCQECKKAIFDYLEMKPILVQT